ncbi:unnamed protein product [Closterium sp. Yama58-4]|nr:unnamed protein product [Closterium sp. Yama58-4]
MARKRKVFSQADEQSWRPEDLAYVAWMNAELANGRPTAKPLRNVGQPPAKSPVAPRATPVTSNVGLQVEYDTDEDDTDKDTADGDDDEDFEFEEPDEAWCGDAEYSGQRDDRPVAPAAAAEKRGSSSRVEARGKGKGSHPAGAKNADCLGTGPKSEWTAKESTILCAARWFTKEELNQMTGKQGSQYWLRLIEHIKKQHPDWCRNATACGNQWKRLKALWKQIEIGDSASGGGMVIKPPWWQWMVLFYEDTAAAEPHALDGGGAVNVTVDPGVKVPKPPTTAATTTPGMCAEC